MSKHAYIDLVLCLKFRFFRDDMPRCSLLKSKNILFFILLLQTFTHPLRTHTLFVLVFPSSPASCLCCTQHTHFEPGCSMFLQMWFVAMHAVSTSLFCVETSIRFCGCIHTSHTWSGMFAGVSIWKAREMVTHQGIESLAHRSRSAHPSSRPCKSKV